MDLERLGAPALAARFLGWYREFSGHPHPRPLTEHYVAYRAHVRAKVACLRQALGESVVLGASWRHEAWRESARRVAEETCSDVVELRCEAPVEVAAARLAARAGDPSDASAATLAAMTVDFDPWPEAAAIDTSGDPGGSVASALDVAGV